MPEGTFYNSHEIHSMVKIGESSINLFLYPEGITYHSEG